MADSDNCSHGNHSNSTDRAQALAEHGDKLYKEDRYEEALPLLQEAVQLGNPLAQYTLGCMYQFGCGVPENQSEALKYYEQIVARYSLNPSKIAGEAVAKSFGCLAIIHLYGSGVPTDQDKAIELYLKGCQYARMSDCVEDYVLDYSYILEDFPKKKLGEHFARLITEVETLRRENQELKTTNQDLQTQIDYSPNGTGYHQAQDEFYALAQHSS
jgi:tetratricopeptide (TPR) repeat protein